MLKRELTPKLVAASYILEGIGTQTHAQNSFRLDVKIIEIWSPYTNRELAIVGLRC